MRCLPEVTQRAGGGTRASIWVSDLETKAPPALGALRGRGSGSRHLRSPRLQGWARAAADKRARPTGPITPVQAHCGQRHSVSGVHTVTYCGLIVTGT